MNQIIEYARRDMKEVSGGKIWNEDDVKIIEEGMKMKEEVSLHAIACDESRVQQIRMLYNIAG